ncbi:MAG: amidophosphoribosyltransferase [Treponema sp.]|nr:amidophosphoribosyltransferase [Treponema sp.]
MGFRDECGVVGIYGAENAAALSYFALVSLQHRGQESAGIAVSDGSKIKLHKGMGLVSDVFEQGHFEALDGNIAVGHVRYATAGGRTIENAQPFMNSFKMGSIALAHNGQLVNYEELREMLEDGGSTFSSTSDTEVILKLIVRKFVENGGKLGHSREEMFRLFQQDNELFVTAVVQAVKEIKGSFAICIMTENMLIGVRDSNGIRPLCIGAIGGGRPPLSSHSVARYPLCGGDPRNAPQSYILTSESCAIDSVNGQFIRDVAPGEIVVISSNEIRSILTNDSLETLGSQNLQKSSKQTCIFEYVYFARPDSVIDGIAVQEARYKMGEVLAKESPVDADVVIGVPDSGLGAAQGYARASGVPYGMGIIKNKYIGRTFIAPTQKERENMVFVKLNAIRSDLEGKRVIVIDDSIVRGTTSRRLVQILRRAGAKEVHFRVSSPPVKFPCYLGIDTPSKNELISSTHELEEIRKEIGADSLAFISLEGMISALSACGNGDIGFCKGCFSGEYPV